MLFSGLVSCSIATGAPPALAVGPNSATEISETSVVLNAVINPRNALTHVKFAISRYSDMTNSYECLAAQSPETGESSLAMSTIVTSLEPSTTYYYQAIATSVYGVTKSPVVEVKTL